MRDVPLTERELQAALRQAARALGFKVYHTWNSQHSPAGFPDLVICGYGRLAFLELKSRGGRLTLAQRQWLQVLSEVTPLTHDVQAHLVRPRDYDATLALLASWQREGRRLYACNVIG